MHDENCGHLEHGHDEHDDCCGHDHGHSGHGDSHGHGHDHLQAALPAPDIEAFGGVDLSGDGGLFKKILTAGDPDSGTPQPGDYVTVHYVGTLTDGTKFDSSRDRPGFFEFDVGIGRVIQGWDKGICTMHRGEKCILLCRADYAYGEGGSPPKIPPNAWLTFEVELFNWKEKRKERHGMPAAARIAEANACKAKGTTLFKAGQFEPALEKYEDASYFCEEESTIDIGDGGAGGPCFLGGDEVPALLVSCYLNAATCALKVQKAERAVKLATKAIAIDGTSVKAFFRRGSARMQLKNWSEAKADLKQASTLDPKSKEVRDAFNECAQKESAAKKSEKALYGRMFG